MTGKSSFALMAALGYAGGYRGAAMDLLTSGTFLEESRPPPGSGGGLKERTRRRRQIAKRMIKVTL